MVPATATSDIEIISTCPPSSGASPGEYLDRVVEAARWSEEAGCTGILVYSDNSLVDPWMVSQLIIQRTARLRPLVAVQPVYMHPYSVAKKITTLAFLHRRRIDLNMVAGGFKNDLTALNDTTPHDRRYERLIEYTSIITRLLEGSAPVGCGGEFYRIEGLRLAPPLDRDLAPGVFISGSSEAGVAAASALGATAVKYPEPAGAYRDGAPHEGMRCGIRVGIIARPNEDRAWETARTRFPEDRRGQLTRQLATKVSDSAWHRRLTSLAEAENDGPYWLGPFRNYKTMCPYLVGSYERVARELAAYVRAGFRTFILDVPAGPRELGHVNETFRRALQAPREDGP